MSSKVSTHSQKTLEKEVILFWILCCSIELWKKFEFQFHSINHLTLDFCCHRTYSSLSLLSRSNRSFSSLLLASSFGSMEVASSWCNHLCLHVLFS
jgi:hypothetical protein